MENEQVKISIYEKLANVQIKLKAPKGQKNTFGNYRYRSCEDILEEVKPILNENKLSLVLSDELVVLGQHNPITYTTSKEETKIAGEQRYYIKATARLYDYEGNTIINTAYAREEENKKGMDSSQITGTASSYARKYALNGLFNIDDTKDADTDEYQNITSPKGKKEEQTTPYDFQSDRDKIRAVPCTEGQKQLLRKITENMLKEELKALNKAKLSDLTYGEAQDILDKNRKKEEEVF